MHMYSVPGLELMLAFQSCSVAAMFLTRALAEIIFSLVEVDLWLQLVAISWWRALEYSPKISRLRALLA